MTGPDPMTRALFGENARHVPAYLYVQDSGPGVVSFVGSSMTPGQENPLRYGAPHWRGATAADDPDWWPHHLVVGEIVVRPHVVIATRALRGFGLAQMLTDAPDLPDLIEGGAGRVVVGSTARLADIIDRSRRGAWRDR